MDFDWTAEDLETRRELEEFLEKELPDWYRGYASESEGHSVEEAFAVTLDISSKMSERGWLTQHWPKAWGGQDASIWQQIVMREVMTEHHEPRGPQYMSANWVGPAIMLYGTDDQKRTFLPEIAAGRSCWAQGFSEPDAGSDLASLKTRAVRDGDEYLINGEKIWTSHTKRAQYIFLLTRTDAEAPKHKGISVFLLPKDTPGVDIRPIKGLLGGDEFANCIFTDVRVPATARLGNENEGWKVTMSALMFERGGIPHFYAAITAVNQVVEFAQSHNGVDGRPLWESADVRQRVVRLRADAEAGRLMYYRVASSLARGEDVAFTNSLARVLGTASVQNARLYLSEIAGPLMQIEENDEGLPFGGGAGARWRGGLVGTVGGGSLEISKNTVATRGLGLPRN